MINHEIEIAPEIREKIAGLGWDRKDVLAIVRAEGAELNAGLLQTLEDVCDKTSQALPVLCRAIEAGLSLDNVEVALTTCRKLGFKWHSSLDITDDVKKLPPDALEAKSAFYKKEGEHVGNCASIDEGTLDKFMRAFGIDNPSKLIKAIRAVYKYAGEDRIDAALQRALDVNDKIWENQKGDVAKVVRALNDAPNKQRRHERDINDAWRLFNSGVREDTF